MAMQAANPKPLKPKPFVLSTVGAKHEIVVGPALDSLQTIEGKYDLAPSLFSGD